MPPDLEERVGVVEVKIDAVARDVSELKELKSQLVKWIGMIVLLSEFGSKIAANLSGAEFVEILKMVMQ